MKRKRFSVEQIVAVLKQAERSVAMTSRRLVFNSSTVAPCECAPGKPGTKPTKSPVSGSRSITAEYVFTAWLRKANG